MNAAVRQRSRLARVRKLQHGLAAGAAAQAAGQVAMLINNGERLAEMRRELLPDQGSTSGAALARRGELAMRIDGARAGLTRSIDQARAVAAARESSRLDARRDQESAEKLQAAAESAAERLIHRASLKARPRRLRKTEE